MIAAPVQSEVTPGHSSPRAPSAWIGPRRSLPALGFAGVCAAAAFTELSADDGQVLCPYRLLTGGWCPGCGCTRALHLLVRGEVRESLSMNPWTLILFVQALALSVALLVVPERTIPWVSERRVLISVFTLAVGLGIWAIRTSLGAIPLPFT